MNNSLKPKSHNCSQITTQTMLLSSMGPVLGHVAMLGCCALGHKLVFLPVHYKCVCVCVCVCVCADKRNDYDHR